MKTFHSLINIIVLLLVIALPAWPDTLILKTGERVPGYFEGGTARVVKFRPSYGGVKEYEILSIQQIQFSDEQKTTVLSATNTPTTAETSEVPERRASSDGPTSSPAAGNASNIAYTFPPGFKMTIRMIDSINSEKQTAGALFVATLEEPMMCSEVEVVPKGADVWGRVTGSAQMGLELTLIVVNGIPYAISTAEYSEAGGSRTGQSVKRAGIGAGIGDGGATAVQVLTKGEKLNIPSETELEFTLSAPLVIAGR